MVRAYLVPCLIVALAGLTTVSVLRQPTARAASPNPSTGWTIHIDAKKHFGSAHPDEIAHHWCKSVANGLTECQIYESDEPNARLVAIETVVPTAVHAGFGPAERPLWHYHKEEIPKVSATTPDMTPEESKKLVSDLTETYGKVWVLWDPLTTPQPVGTPWVSIVN